MWSWGQFVNDNAVIGDKHFDTQHSDDIQAVKNPLCKVGCAGLQLFGSKWRRDKCGVQDVVSVDILY